MKLKVTTMKTNYFRKLTIVGGAFLGICLSTYSGLYFVSGNMDFRPSPIRYVIETTEPNETATISPVSLVLLSNWQANSAYFSPWSLKTDGNEFKYGEKDNINYGALKNGCTNVPVKTYTYETPGRHLVKYVDLNGNLFNATFEYNTNIVSMSIKLSNAKSAAAFGKNYIVHVRDLPNLKELKYDLPVNQKRSFGAMGVIRNLPKLDHLYVSNMNQYTNLSTSIFQMCSMTNNMYFDSIVNVGTWTLYQSYRVGYVSFANAVKIGGSVLNVSKTSDSNLAENGWGLKTLRIGDTFTILDGQDSFWGQT